MEQEQVVFSSGNLRLEGILVKPSGAGSGAGAVLCHPHPLYGGNMNNNVIHAVSRALVEKGIAAFRFNFRSVGQSEGSYDDGKGEVADALAAVYYLAGRDDIEKTRVGLMGYSFGGTVALAAGIRNEDTVKAVAAVSPPAFPGLGIDKPSLVVCGTKDSMVPIAGILELKDKITASGAGIVEVVEGADHFWTGREEVAAELIAEFFTRHLTGDS